MLPGWPHTSWMAPYFMDGPMLQCDCHESRRSERLLFSIGESITISNHAGHITVSGRRSFTRMSGENVEWVPLENFILSPETEGVTTLPLR